MTSLRETQNGRDNCCEHEYAADADEQRENRGNNEAGHVVSPPVAQPRMAAITVASTSMPPMPMNSVSIVESMRPIMRSLLQFLLRVHQQGRGVLGQGNPLATHRHQQTGDCAR